MANNLPKIPKKEVFDLELELKSVSRVISENTSFLESWKSSELPQPSKVLSESKPKQHWDQSE